MKKLNFCFLLIIAFAISSAVPYISDELDRVYVYLNSKLAGAWRADESGVVHIDKIADGDTLIFRARTDLGGLGNSSIDIKDDAGLTVENIRDLGSSAGTADFVYVLRLKKINVLTVNSLQVFLNVDPARNLPPPVIAIITIPK